MTDQKEEETSFKHPPNTTTIDKLPREVKLEIMSRLPVESLIRAKWVCNSWRTLAHDPLLASLQFSLSAKNYNPCLILHDIENHLCSLHFSAAAATMTRLFVPMIPQFSIVGSCNGLLCLFDPFYREEAYIFNPFTRVYTQLPKPKQFPTQNQQQRVAMGFSFCSVTKEYKVVRIVYNRNDSEVEVLTIKNCDSAWRSKGKTCYQIEGGPSNVLVNGRLHWLSHRRGYQDHVKIISFNVEDEEFREVPNPSSYEKFAVLCSHLVVLRGCLCGVLQGCGVVDIWAMKEYGVPESWVKEFRIFYGSPREFRYRNQDFDLDLPNGLINFSEAAQVLCMLENGEILLQHGYRTLISYEVRNGSLKLIATKRGLPACFKTIVHIGSLNWIDTPIIL